ncbi:hypothetical protein R3P38DRAFT_3038393 [Favolaschia claudopus]|uniref:Uncharacterized protein n=1 Tax=Favolaschia claudopus TaxID=2862362 RepID=A0AAW0AC87_9AGAR
MPWYDVAETAFASIFSFHSFSSLYRGLGHPFCPSPSPIMTMSMAFHMVWLRFTAPRLFYLFIHHHFIFNCRFVCSGLPLSGLRRGLYSMLSALPFCTLQLLYGVARRPRRYILFSIAFGSQASCGWRLGLLLLL